jgi:5'-methylthioadenosine phosphorylase
MIECVAVVGSAELTDTAVYRTAELTDVHTNFGPVELAISDDDGHRVVWLTRGGVQSTAAHAINHRANIAALEKLGVKQVFATAMVGSLHAGLSIGTILILDQFIDFVHAPSYHEDDVYRDFDMTEPYCPTLRELLVHVARQAQVPVNPTGCYVGVCGPRFETAAEVKMYRQFGGDVVGMTGSTECIMARQAGMCYASVAGVVNLGAGLSQTRLSAKNFKAQRKKLVPLMIEVIDAALARRQVSSMQQCSCISFDSERL